MMISGSCLVESGTGTLNPLGPVGCTARCQKRQFVSAHFGDTQIEVGGRERAEQRDTVVVFVLTMGGYQQFLKVTPLKTMVYSAYCESSYDTPNGKSHKCRQARYFA
ncbi:hypothetical protein ILYODFUR_022479 [Ilyodon furcidens]|uniref:Uncharacterized protein n=1 Tax=Ilyodon furcidens TaxID=33524 RepID=A0ABV0T0M0_9TELE